MRDKVKRFLSILMTALMLVNLLPVGALAEGVMISNSVQSRESETQTLQTDKRHVYVYARVPDATDEQKKEWQLNADKWYFIGICTLDFDMPNGILTKQKWGNDWYISTNGVYDECYKKYRGPGVQGLPAYNAVISKLDRSSGNSANLSIPMTSQTIKGYKLEDGVTEGYINPDGAFAWHLDIEVSAAQIAVNYKICYWDNNGNKIAADEYKGGIAGEQTEAIDANNDTLAALGYETIALAAKDVAAWDEQAFEAAKRKLQAGPLQTVSLNSFCTPALRLNGAGYDPKKLEAYMQALSSRANGLGYRYIGIGAPQSRNVSAGQDRRRALDEMREAFEILCDAAAPHGVEVLMESVCSVECNLVTTTREAAAFIQGVRRSNLHLVYDVYHEAMEGQSVDVIRDVADEIRVVHIAQDVNHGQRAYLDEEHLAAYRPYWDMLTRVGYQGEWNIESFVGNVEAGLKNSMTVTKRLRKGV